MVVGLGSIASVLKCGASKCKPQNEMTFRKALGGSASCICPASRCIISESRPLMGWVWWRAGWVRAVEGCAATWWVALSINRPEKSNDLSGKAMYVALNTIQTPRHPK